jgi:hypothetical protein
LSKKIIEVVTDRRFKGLKDDITAIVDLALYIVSLVKGRKMYKYIEFMNYGGRVRHANRIP